jgi:excisionase family DNA binding protein
MTGARSGTGGAPVLHTSEEAAKVLRVSKSWLERRAAARKIPFTMLGGCYRFTDAHLAEIVRMHEQRPGLAADDAPPPSLRRNAGTGQAAVPVAPLRPRPGGGRRRVA